MYLVGAVEVEIAAVKNTRYHLALIYDIVDCMVFRFYLPGQGLARSNFVASVLAYSALKQVVPQNFQETSHVKH